MSALFFSSMAMTYWNLSKSDGLSGREMDVSFTPRLLAAAVMRRSALSPSWYEKPPVSYQLELPPPVPQLSMSNSSARPARSASARKVASAVGLRQMLPVQLVGEQWGSLWVNCGGVCGG